MEAEKFLIFKIGRKLVGGIFLGELIAMRGPLRVYDEVWVKEWGCDFGNYAYRILAVIEFNPSIEYGPITPGICKVSRQDLRNSGTFIEQNRWTHGSWSRWHIGLDFSIDLHQKLLLNLRMSELRKNVVRCNICLLYTSDAADE